jgi:hypothetical protein
MEIKRITPYFQSENCYQMILTGQWDTSYITVIWGNPGRLLTIRTTTFLTVYAQPSATQCTTMVRLEVTSISSWYFAERSRSTHPNFSYTDASSQLEFLNVNSVLHYYLWIFDNGCATSTVNCFNTIELETWIFIVALNNSLVVKSIIILFILRQEPLPGLSAQYGKLNKATDSSI